MSTKNHWCGCVTLLKHENTIYFLRICNYHKQTRNFIWIAIHHIASEKQKSKSKAPEELTQP